jgi:hypothetical protein
MLKNTIHLQIKLWDNNKYEKCVQFHINLHIIHHANNRIVEGPMQGFIGAYSCFDTFIFAKLFFYTMLPKTELKYSWMYNSVYIKDFKKENINRLKDSCKSFEGIYKKHNKEILKLIEKHFQKWKQEYIPIYLIEKGPVFSDPITIRYEEEAKIMLIRVLHELIHNNIQKKKFKNDYLLHAYMDKKTKLILDELSIDLNSQFWVLEKMTEKFRKMFS